MSLSLPSQASQFVFQFPSSFVPEHINEKYKIMLDEMHSPYENVLDYVNSCIRSITFPGIDIEKVQQLKTFGKKIYHKPVTNVHDTLRGDITITMENVDSMLSYKITQELFLYHYMDTSKTHMDSFVMFMLNIGRRNIFNIYFDKVVPLSMSELNFDFGDYQLKDNTFTLTFGYVWFESKYIPLPEYLFKSKKGNTLDDLIIEQGLRPSNRTYNPTG